MLRISITNETHKREEVRITVVVLVEVVDNCRDRKFLFDFVIFAQYYNFAAAPKSRKLTAGFLVWIIEAVEKVAPVVKWVLFSENLDMSSQLSLSQSAKCSRQLLRNVFVRLWGRYKGT